MVGRGLTAWGATNIDERALPRLEPMNEIKQHHHQHGDPNGGSVHQGRPYWTRAHRDWRVWVGVVLMLLAMIIYIMTGDLRWRPRIQAHSPLSGAAGEQP